MDPERFYARLPVPLQNVAASLEGWRIRRSRFGRRFHELLGGYLEREGWAPERVTALRDERLARFVRHAAETVPYYRDRFAELGIGSDAIRRLGDLPSLPVLDKRTVQDHLARFVSDAVPRKDTAQTHTSGSTGAGLVFPVTLDAQREQWAVWWRFRMRHGLTLDTPCLFLGGRSVVPSTQKRPPYWRYNRPGRQILFSGYHLGPDTAADYLGEIRRSGWRWIHGYPSLVSLLASHALELGARLPMQWVSLGAESVLPHQAALIEEAFGVRPITHYGMAEGVANISMTAEGRFEVDEDYAAVEFVPRNDGRYDIFGTNFTNPAFPLLRYRVGDIATLPDPPDGAVPRRVVRVDGRQEDYVVAKSGARLGRLDHVFKDMVHIREAQIRQQRVGEMTLYVVRGPDYTDADERRLVAETRKRVGDEVSFTIAYCDRLPKTRSGKLRFVVSELPEGQLTDVR